MLRRFSVDFAIISMFIDAVLVMIALYLAEKLRPLIHILPFTKPYTAAITLPFELYIIFALLWVIVFLIFSVYDTRRNFRWVDELSCILTASILAIVVIAGFLFLTYRETSRALILSFFIFALIFILLFRILYRLSYKVGAFHLTQRRRVLIIGCGRVGKQAMEQINEYSGLGFEFIGFLDDNPKKDGKMQVLGNLSSARHVVMTNKIDDVIMALPQNAYKQINQLVAELLDLPIKVWIVPDYFSLALNRAIIGELGGLPLIALRAPALNDYQRMIKRLFDIALIFTFLPIILPLFGLIAIAIRVDTPGPIIFRQKRAGENGRFFEMIKFRSMVVNAETQNSIIEKIDVNGKIVQDKSQKDPRITRIGKILRSTSLDELPQLFNVLRGEMSLVGPRPELPHLVEQYEPWQRTRFAVPQGMTGWWQVNGRSDKPMNQHTDEDLYYIQHYSIWLDLQILIKTIFVVVTRRGAY